MSIKRITPIFTLLLLCLPQAASASDFATWLNGFRSQALQHGISERVFDMAFDGVTPDPRVVELDQKQPERSKMGFATYLKNVLAQKRIDQGRINYAANRAALKNVEATYGVPAGVIVALWGVETSYGANTGGYDLVRSLATLAWEGRRADFFKNELLNALQILEGGHVNRPDFKGSWAGAMGQCQFMPTSWVKYAVDGNGDGHKDIWTTKADVFASTANYLHESGWDNSMKWGYSVQVPANYKAKNPKQSVIEWISSGVKFTGSMPNLEAHTQLELIIPDDGDGRAYLVTNNYNVIKKWNRSTYFALTVGLLSDLVVKGGAPIPQSHMNP